MKTLFSLIISAALVASGYSQTRNVLVGTNNAVVQPTNFWSADATNARSGLGLGSAATNLSSAFQPSSATLSNLASSNGSALINLQATNIVGTIPSSNIPSFTFTNISETLTIAQGGTSATNAANARQNFGATAVGDALFTASNAATARTAIGVTTVGGSIFTLVNPSAITFLRVNADNTVSAIGASDFRTAIGLGSLATNSSGAFQPASSMLTNLASSNAFYLSNIQASNIVGLLSLSNGGTGADNAINARANLGLGSAATNPASAFQPSSTMLSNLASSNGGNLTNITISNVTGLLATNGNGAGLTNLTASNITGTIAISNGGTGATNVATARTNLGLGATNDVTFDDVQATSFLVGDETNSQIAFEGNSAATTRTNLGLGWSALTNTNAATSLLGFTTNGQVVANTGTNVLTFTNALNASNRVTITVTNSENIDVFTVIGGGSGVGVDAGVVIRNGSISGYNNLVPATFSLTVGGLDFSSSISKAATRANLGLGATWLTNTNVTNFRTAIGLSWSALTNTNAGTGLVSVNTNGTVVSPTNFWTASPLGRVGYIQYSAPITNSTNSAEAARNLFVFSLAPTINGVTNTIQLPVTTNSALYGDIAVVVHQGPTNSATIVRNGIDLITLREDNEAISLLYGTNGWGFYPNLAFHEPIYFTTTNAALYAARSRTNLALGATWLTNTNVINFRTAIGLGTTNNVEFNELRLGGSSQMHMRGSAGNISFYNGIESENVLLIPADTDPVEINSQWNDANVRSNLGLPLSALTSTNNATFQEAVFTTNAAPTNGANFGDRVGWMGVSIVTNGVTNVFRIPLYK